jgi:hypothetical protein|tara:strand:+ start:74 stop:487 length:414 start_codon:yes stop_codon:yes gene_type:complete
MSRVDELKQRLAAIIDDVFDEKRGHAKELQHEQAGITGVTELESGKHIVSLGGGKSGIALHKEVGSNLEDVIAGGDELKDEATRALKLDEKPAKRKFMRQKLRKFNRKSNRKGILGLEKNFKYPLDPLPKSVGRRRR